MLEASGALTPPPTDAATATEAAVDAQPSTGEVTTETGAITAEASDGGEGVAAEVEGIKGDEAREGESTQEGAS